jgi:hypothetical protein
MDARDASGNRAWDVLWYAITSFLQGYDDERQNAYLNFMMREEYHDSLLIGGQTAACTRLGKAAQ